ncbi:MAG: aminomethyltransferase family protein [Pyrinomonadaceae bacterium]
MAEAVEHIKVKDSPLIDAHNRHGVEMRIEDGWSVPGSYGDLLFEYAAVRESGAGLIDMSSRGRLVVSGTEAIQFLNGLITNEMKTLREESWMAAAFPNVQGRVIASVRVIRFKDNQSGKNASPAFLIDTEPVTHERVLKTIERFTLAGDFKVEDISNQTAQVSVQGKKSANLIRAVIGEDASALAPDAAIRTAVQETELTVVRGTHTGEDGFDLILNRERAIILWNALHAAGGRPVGYDALEILRIEAGLPRYGKDMDETNIVTEAALDSAVSYTKGCYVGQEIIARIKYRGHVAKKLSGLAFDQFVKVEAGAPIKAVDGKEVGRVTSRTNSPHLGRTIGLAYVKYDYLTPNTSVKVAAGDAELSAHITQLPFVSR